MNPQPTRVTSEAPQLSPAYPGPGFAGDGQSGPRTPTKQLAKYSSSAERTVPIVLPPAPGNGATAAITLQYTVKTIGSGSNNVNQQQDQQGRMAEYLRETLRIHTALQGGNHFFGTPLYAASIVKGKSSSSSSSLHTPQYVTAVTHGSDGGRIVSLEEWMLSARTSGTFPSAQQVSTLFFQMLLLKLVLVRETTVLPVPENTLHFTPRQLALRRTLAKPTVLELQYGSSVWLLTSGQSAFGDLRYADQQSSDIAFHLDGLLHFNIPHTLETAVPKIPLPSQTSGPGGSVAVQLTAAEQATLRPGAGQWPLTVDDYLETVYPYTLPPEGIAEFFAPAMPSNKGNATLRQYWEIGCTIASLSTLQYAQPEYIPPSLRTAVGTAAGTLTSVRPIVTSLPWTLFPLGRVYTDLIPVYRDLYELYTASQPPPSTLPPPPSQQSVVSYAKTRYSHLGPTVARKFSEVLAAMQQPTDMAATATVEAVHFFALANHLVFVLLFRRALGSRAADERQALHPTLARLLLDTHANSLEDFALASYYTTSALISRYRENRAAAAAAATNMSAANPDLPVLPQPQLLFERAKRLQQAPSFYVPYTDALAHRLGEQGIVLLSSMFSLQPAERGALPVPAQLLPSSGSDDEANRVAAVLEHPYFQVQHISLATFIEKYVADLTMALKPLSRFYAKTYRIDENGTTGLAAVPASKNFLAQDMTILRRLVTRRINNLWWTIPPLVFPPANVDNDPAGRRELLLVYDSFSRDIVDP